MAPLNAGVMPLIRRLLAALAATALAVAIATAVVYFDAIADRSGDAMDAAAKGAGSWPPLLAALFIFYLTVANLRPLWKSRPYLSVATSVVVAVIVLAAIPGAVWVAVDGASLLSPATYGPIVTAILAGVAWLLPGALLEVPICSGITARSSGP